MSENGSRIHLLGHQGKRPTKAQVEQEMADHIATIARASVVPVVEHYMVQVPELVAKMLAEAFKAHGLVMQPPPEAAPTSGDDLQRDQSSSGEPQAGEAVGVQTPIGGAPPHPCPWCKAEFWREDNLIAHLDAHEVERRAT